MRIGVDVGSVRIGIAQSDPSGVLATPVRTLPRKAGDCEWIATFVDELAVVEIVVGLPRSLSGREGPAADAVRQFATTLAAAVSPVPVRLFDERLTTVTAEAMLRERGTKGQNRRAVVDQAAAVVILQTALDTERSSGRAPGELVAAKEPTR